MMLPDLIVGVSNRAESPESGCCVTLSLGAQKTAKSSGCCCWHVLHLCCCRRGRRHESLLLLTCAGRHEVFAGSFGV